MSRKTSKRQNTVSNKTAKRHSAVPPKASFALEAIAESATAAAVETPVVAEQAPAMSESISAAGEIVETPIIAATVSEAITAETVMESATFSPAVEATVAVTTSAEVIVETASVTEFTPVTDAAPTIEPAGFGLEIQSLLNDMDSWSAYTRAAAATDLGRLGDRAGVSALINALGDANADVAREAAVSLGLLGDVSAVEALIAVAENFDGYYHGVVRAAAVASLGQIGDSRAAASLLRILSDPIAEVSTEAIGALAALNDPATVGALLEIVSNFSGYYLPTVRAAAIRALARIGGEQVVAELTAVAADIDENPDIRDAADEALCEGRSFAQAA